MVGNRVFYIIHHTSQSILRIYELEHKPQTMLSQIFQLKTLWLLVDHKYFAPLNHIFSQIPDNQLNVYYVIPTIVKHNFKIPSTRNSGKGNGYIYTKQFTEASKKITIV